MKLWHRAPRQVYRVYGEDEYLAQDDLQAQETGPTPVDGYGYGDHAVASSRPHSSRAGRLVGLCLFVGVSAGALGLVVVNVLHRSRVASRSVIAQGARNPPTNDASAGAHAHAAVSSGAAIKWAGAVRAKTPSSSGSALTRTSASVDGATPSAHEPRTHTPQARVCAYPRPSSGRSIGLAPGATWIETDQPPLSSSGIPYPDAPPPSVDGEFGFER